MHVYSIVLPIAFVFRWFGSIALLCSFWSEIYNVVGRICSKGFFHLHRLKMMSKYLVGTQRLLLVKIQLPTWKTVVNTYSSVCDMLDKSFKHFFLIQSLMFDEAISTIYKLYCSNTTIFKIGLKLIQYHIIENAYIAIMNSGVPMKLARAKKNQLFNQFTLQKSINPL